MMRRKKIAILLAIILAQIFASVISNVQAIELSSEKSTSIMKDVIGVNTTKYSVLTKQYPDDTYRDIIPRENIRVNLDTAGSKVEALCRYVNNSLQMVYVSANEGSPFMNVPSTSDTANAQAILTNYQTKYNNQFYGELDAMLAEANENKNYSAIAGNLKLNVEALKNDTTFRWIYTLNGMEAPEKSVSLRFKNGFLKYFTDDWSFYKVGNTEVNLSGQEAIDIAMNRAKEYKNGTIGGIRFNVTNAMVIKKIFSSSLRVDKPRSTDLLELYPMYHVWVSLDKFYPGNVYGFNVYIWADTKEVCYINPRVTTLDPPADLVATVDTPEYSTNQTPDITANVDVKTDLLSMQIVLPLCAVTVLIMMPMLMYPIVKKKSVTFINLSKMHCLRISCVLLCFLVVSLLFVAASASIVSATLPQRAASIWGSESEYSINHSLNPPESWRKTNAEVDWQRQVSIYIDSLFDIMTITRRIIKVIITTTQLRMTY